MLEKKKIFPASPCQRRVEKKRNKTKTGENLSVGVERRDIALRPEKPIEAAGAETAAAAGWG